jgi:hypothetical protein
MLVFDHVSASSEDMKSESGDSDEHKQ